MFLVLSAPISLQLNNMKNDSPASGQKARRVLRNTGSLWAGQAVYMACMLLWTVIIVRYIGPKVYGVYAYAQASVAIVLLFVNLGLNQLLIRDIAQQPALFKIYRKHALRINLILGTILLGGLTAWTLLNSSFQPYGAITAIVAANGLFTALAAIEIALINAREAMQYVALAQVVNSVLTLATGAVGVWTGLSFQAILLLSLASSGVFLVMLNLFCKRVFSKICTTEKKAENSWKDTIGFAGKSLPFWALALIAGLSANMGVLFLKWLGQGESVVGQFAAAQRIFAMIIIIPGLLGQAIFPTLSQAFAESPEGGRRIFQIAWRYYFIMTIPMAAGLWLVADKVVLLLYGPDFSESAAMLRILVLMLLNGVGFFAGRTMMAIHKEKISAAIQWCTLAGVVVASYWAIPHYGALGLCWSMVGRSILGFLVYSTLLFFWFRQRFPWMWCLKTIGATVFMSLIVCWISDYSAGLFFTIPVAAIVYVLYHFVFNTISNEDRAVIGKVFGRYQV